MSQTLSLDRDYLNQVEDYPNNPKPKKKTLVKILISIFIILVILICGFIGFYLYSSNKELNALNSNVNTYNSIVSQINSNKTNITASDCSSYSTQLKSLSDSFKTLENSKFISNSNKTLITNYANLTSYLTANYNLLSEYLTLSVSAENSKSLTLNQLQDLINKLNGLLSSNDFTQMKNTYNNNSFVNQNVSTHNSPADFESMVNKTVTKLSNLSKFEVFTNNISNFFKLGNIFTNTLQ